MTYHLLAKDGCIEFTPDKTGGDKVKISVLKDDGSSREVHLTREQARTLYKDLKKKGYRS
jgi:hypothetical protein